MAIGSGAGLSFFLGLSSILPPEASLGIRQFPANQATWGIFMNSCVLAAVHLNKNEDQFQRATTRSPESPTPNRCKRLYPDVASPYNDWRLSWWTPDRWNGEPN